MAGRACEPAYRSRRQSSTSAAAAGYRWPAPSPTPVTRSPGVDISDVQIERARRLVPAGAFIRADAAQVDFPPASFDAVVCLYALIHLPLDDQPGPLRRVVTWLRPGGWLLATTGYRAWTGTEDNWLGGPAAMWWSHADAGTYRSWLSEAGLDITPRSSSRRAQAGTRCSGRSGRAGPAATATSAPGG